MNELPWPLQDGALAALFIEVPEEIRVLPLLSFAKQGGHQRDAIIFFTRLHVCQFAHGGHEILKATDVIAHASGFDFSRPMSNERNADAAIGQLTFDAFQRTVGFEKVCIVQTFRMGTVVAGEEDERVLFNAERFHFRHDGSDFVVHEAHDAGESLLYIWPVLVREFTIAWRLQAVT